MINGLILTLMVLTQVFGDLWLSQGMKKFGAVQVPDIQAAFTLLAYLLTSPWIILGVITLIFSLGFYIVAVSRFDLSYVLPIHSSGYVFNAFFAWMLLGEHVSTLRWVATVLVAFGVYLINRTNSRLPPQQAQKPWNPHKIPAPLFLFSATSAISKIWLGIAVLVLADAAGDILLAKGIKKIGRISLRSPAALLKLIGQVLTNPSVIQGIFAQAVAFCAFLCLLSWADVSYIRPTTALTYATSLLGARYILKEQLVPGRLMGSLVIGVGVVMVALS